MENILVVPTALVRPYLTESGLIRGCERKLYEIIDRNHLFLPRPEAEQNPTYKQIIPYITLCRGNEVFYTRRLNKGGEARLHGRISLGIGGHINSFDAEAGGSIFEQGLRRELEEEVSVTSPGELIPLGVINDDTNEVGRVHLGFFFRMEVEDAAVLETEKLEGFWGTPEDLRSHLNEMESWSQIAMTVL